jgi:hypothetical protein
MIPEPPAAGPGHGHPPAHALHGLRRLLGGLCLAITALIGGRLDATWARWSRPWTTMAWAFLSVGIALGSGWAYYVLGWGGWWFWDPVENASFMPWLAGTALMHSLAFFRSPSSPAPLRREREPGFFQLFTLHPSPFIPHSSPFSSPISLTPTTAPAQSPAPASRCCAGAAWATPASVSAPPPQEGSRG